METWEDAFLYGLAAAGAVALSEWFRLIGLLVALALTSLLIKRREHKLRERGRELRRLKLLENSGGFY